MTDVCHSPTPPPSVRSPVPESTSLFSWDTRASSPILRQEAQGAPAGDELYVFGGFHQGLKTTARSDVYEPSTNTWRRIADMPEQLTHSPVVVVGKVIWFFGGYVGNHPGGATTHVWRYDTTTDTWTRGAAMPTPRHGIFPVVVAGRIIVAGGGTKAGFSNANVVETFNP